MYYHNVRVHSQNHFATEQENEFKFILLLYQGKSKFTNKLQLGPWNYAKAMLQLHVQVKHNLLNSALKKLKRNVVECRSALFKGRMPSPHFTF